MLEKEEHKNIENISTKNILPNIDQEFEPIVKDDDFDLESDNENVELMVDKIKNVNNQNNNLENHINEKQYTEVSDDEFFDDFFDE